MIRIFKILSNAVYDKQGIDRTTQIVKGTKPVRERDEINLLNELLLIIPRVIDPMS